MGSRHVKPDWSQSTDAHFRKRNVLFLYFSNHVECITLPLVIEGLIEDSDS